MKKCDGFKEIKNTVIKCLKSGNIQHESRTNIDVKNLLATGELTIDFVIEILKKSRGNEYTSSPHHYDSTVDVHVIRTQSNGFAWYVKWYYKSPDCFFISVHK